MQVAVIGAGVVGVCTAYFLAEAGHEVIVMERRNNIAEEASFGDSGILAADAVAPWAAPGMPKSLLSLLMKPESPLFLNRTWDPALWSWMRRWIKECDIERYRRNRGAMQRVAAYSHEITQHLRDRHQLDYEQAAGYLQVYRSEHELQQAKPAFDFLKESGIRHEILAMEDVRLIEPALNSSARLAGGLHLPQAESGNCPLFARQIRQLAQAMGVEFHFGCNVKAIHQSYRGVLMQVDDLNLSADAVVLATGADSAALLAPLGIRLPTLPVKYCAATATIRNFESVPLNALMDETYKTSIARLGNRIRIAGTAELGARATTPRQAAMNTLLKVAYDWFPDACHYNAATFWSGSSMTLPDGVPLIGATAIRNVFLNIGHGTAGWAMAAGAGKLAADIVSDRATDISADGLAALRYQ
jgi:D-amino-acid dehydrogenase